MDTFKNKLIVAVDEGKKLLDECVSGLSNKELTNMHFAMAYEGLLGSGQSSVEKAAKVALLNVIAEEMILRDIKAQDGNVVDPDHVRIPVKEESNPFSRVTIPSEN